MTKPISSLQIIHVVSQHVLNGIQEMFHCQHANYSCVWAWVFKWMCWV